MAKFEIKWEAPEFEYVAALIVAFAAWQKDFLFGLFIVIAEMLFIVWGNKVPPVVEFTVTDTDIDIGGYKSYQMKEFESWSADSDGVGTADIVFYFRSRFHPPLVMITWDEKLVELRANLKTVLKEIEHEPTLIDSIERFLRF
jgi:hypothetical protein